MRIFSEITYLSEFERDMKKLTKRYRTLPDDLKIFIKTPLKLYHREGMNTADIHQIPGLGFETPRVYKVRKVACRALKGRGKQSGIRIVYAYFEELDKVEFIEIYFKGDKTNHDRKRILEHY